MRDEARANVVRDLAEYSETMSLRSLMRSYPSPLFFLDAEQVKRQYRTLEEALPMVRHHFAIKALRHPAVLAAVDECGGYFDVMTNSDVDLVQAQKVAPERCIHTNPVKKPRDIRYALAAGLTTFVVDNASEVDKFVPYADRVQLLVRLSFRNVDAKSDLSFKFGVAPAEAESLVRYARRQGLTVAGFSLHVGSQIHSAQAYVEAIRRATQLMDAVERTQHLTLSVLDIGGGFPVDYLTPAPTIQEISRAIIPLLTPLVGRVRILSEPGRFLVAPSMTLVTQVVGKSVRGGKRWYYIDDGVYGSYSNVVFENVTPHIIALSEIETRRTLPLSPSTIAGPTCDSVDVVTTDCPLPELEVGDYLVSPMMGAYTAVSATEYNGIARTPVIELR
jgi:ornithine decarboxylase